MLILQADDPADASAVAQILYDWCNFTVRVRGTSKKAEEIATAEQAAVFETTARCLTAILNQKRIETYPQLAKEGIPGILTSDLYKKLREIKFSYERMIEATKDHAERKKRIDIFLTEDVERFILNTVIDENVYNLEEERHRKAVLAGKESATEDDKNTWLLEMAKARQAEADRYNKLVSD